MSRVTQRPTARLPQERPTARLPQEQTTFVGRAAELAQLSAMLDAARLVTVTGTGGIGKTRLALRAAAESESAFPGGTALVELSALRDPELLAHTVVAVLGLPERDPRPRLEQVLDYLRERRLLLILDTCEHLVEACALFAEAVLTQTVNVTILATSRQPLDVAGEHAFPLLPLAVPPTSEATDGGKTLPMGGDRDDDTAGGDAVDLFAQRAAAVVPGFEVTNATRADIVRLCRHLDGIPLAIELAAGRLRELSLGELTERLGRRFADLTGAQRATVDRHQTLRDAIGWSYDLCTSPERALWERLSVFAGPFGIEAAGQACAGRGLDRGAVMDTVLTLVDKSVLIRGDGDVSRYQMLDTIREYGDERLAASGIRRQRRKIRPSSWRRPSACSSVVGGVGVGVGGAALNVAEWWGALLVVDDVVGRGCGRGLGLDPGARCPARPGRR